MGIPSFRFNNASGGHWDRPSLHNMLDQLRAGDVIVVWKLDPLSRSLKDLLVIMEKIDEAIETAVVRIHWQNNKKSAVTALFSEH